MFTNILPSSMGIRHDLIVGTISGLIVCIVIIGIGVTFLISNSGLVNEGKNTALMLLTL